MDSNQTTSSIFVTERDHRRLTTLLDTSLTYRYPRESARLGEVLARAEIAPGGALPDGVVGMGSRVFCEDAGGEPQEVVLVYPWDEDRYYGHVSVLSPIGVALLGLRAGEGADYVDESGVIRHARVLHVSSLGREIHRDG